MLRAGRDVNGAVTDLYGRYGPVFAFGAGPLRFVWFVGPEANRFVLEEAAEHFTLGSAYGFLRTIGGDTALITSDEPEHRRRRRLVQPAFYRARLAQLDVLIEARLRELFRSWVGRTVDLYREVQGCVLELICEVLLGGAAVRTALTSDIARMMRFANLPFHLQLVKLPVPGSPWARFVAARSRADHALYAELGRRRAAVPDKNRPHEGAAGDDALSGDVPRGDVLDLLLAAQDEQGEGLSDREIRDQAVSLVSAGFDTTSAAFSWAIYELLRQPARLGDLRAGLESSAEPPLLGYTVKETLRLYPPAPAGLRRTARALEFGGYSVPSGQLSAFSIYATHRLASVYPDPLAFKPERWETFTPPPYSYLPFGNGARYCIGAGLATRILTLGLGTLFRDFRLSPAWSEPVHEAGNTLHPRGGLLVTVRAASARRR